MSEPIDYAWVRDQMPIRLVFNVTSDDGWLRQMIRGEDLTRLPPRLQEVIVQGTTEADRVVAGLANLKYHLGLPYGGCLRERWPSAPSGRVA